jgi:hypothetical protein
LRLQLEVLLKVQKQGNAPEDYEDAIAYRSGDPECHDNGFPLVVAIADGATESSFSKLWAELLVTEFVHDPFMTSDDMKRSVARCARLWSRIVRKKPLPWYAEEKVKMGSFSTLLGVQFLPPNSDGLGRWQAIALGDSCLFQIGPEGPVTQFPITAYEDFGSTPPLVSTDAAYNSRSWNELAYIEGAWTRDDFFLLMTDALSQWATKEHPARSVWDELLATFLSDNGSNLLRDWVDRQRQSGTIRNDDITLAVVRENEATSP